MIECHVPLSHSVFVLFISRIIMMPTAVEFLVHLSLSAAVASVNSLAEEGLVDLSLNKLD